MNALSKVCRSGWPPVNSARAHLILSIVLTGALCEPVLADKTPSEIEVFIDSMNPVANYADGITVYYIDRIDRLQKELSIDLPADPEAANRLPFIASNALTAISAVNWKMLRKALCRRCNTALIATRPLSSMAKRWFTASPMFERQPSGISSGRPGRLDHDARYPPLWIHPADVDAPY